MTGLLLKIKRIDILEACSYQATYRMKLLGTDIGSFLIFILAFIPSMIHERPRCAVALKKFLPSTRLRHPFFTTILDDRNPTLPTSENSSRHSKRNHFFRISDIYA